ncbi:hypothetical protein GCM10011344_02680 [Dokdonia pacifica]|nr:hypothetical protein GCM10011344_02680 [Dokdonia pacifica]
MPMIPPIVLPKTNVSEATSILETWMNKPVVLWVVLGEGSVADTAVAKSEELINSTDPDDNPYHLARVVHAPDPSLILEKLKSLRVNPRLREPIEWNNLTKYIILSISVNTDTIGAIVLKSKFPNQPRGYINRILRKALAVDAV